MALHLPDYRHDRPGDSFRGWLRTITHNKVCNFFRSRAAKVRARGGTPGSVDTFTMSVRAAGAGQDYPIDIRRGTRMMHLTVHLGPAPRVGLTVGQPPLNMSDPFPAALATSSLLSTANDPKQRDGYVQQWNLTLQTPLGKTMALETAYVGTKGTHLGSFWNVNTNKPRRT